MVLIIGDWAIDKVRTGGSAVFSPASVIESERREVEDAPQKKRAAMNGYSSVITPSLVQHQPALRRRALEQGTGIVGGLPNSLTYLCNEGYGLVTYRSDRFGLRNQDFKWDRTIDTIFIGDSFTHGACVHAGETIPDVYETITGEKSINLGFGGNDPSNYAALSEIFIPLLKPRKVVMIFYVNDNVMDFELNSAFENGYVPNPIFKAYVDNNNYFASGLGNRVKELPKKSLEMLWEVNSWKQQHTQPNSFSLFEKFYAFINYRVSLPTIRRLLNEDQGYVEKGAEISRKAINIAHNRCKENGCKLIVGYIPNSTFWRSVYFEEEYREILKGFALEKTLPFLDMSEELNRDEGSLDYAIKGSHLSPLGYSKVAQRLAKEE